MNTKIKTIKRIADERQKQIDSGWTPEHDDEHDGGELVKAAICYALGDTEIRSPAGEMSVEINPFGIDFYRSMKAKPKIRQLEIAAALIVAEIERLERVESGKLNDLKKNIS